MMVLSLFTIKISNILHLKFTKLVMGCLQPLSVIYLSIKSLQSATRFSIFQAERVNGKNRNNFCIKICMIRFLKVRMSSISSDLYEEILNE